ncbi:MAG: tRNA pseudouridine(55) synthase TruB [Roseburia sp.]|nr:tRNA pseudouridine(55) synthase TruB [Roseburia sp.]
MYNGIINVYKEAGFTSHDVVAKLRGILKQKKIGHTGTLDPQAVGVLPVCLGSGTKLCDMLTDKDKEYIAELLLGVSTDTQDMEGRILRQRLVAASEGEVREAVMAFVGEYAQIPPMYSALKVNGKKLYELARAGREIERKPRPVQIREMEILEMDMPVVKLRVVCSKGTYIRTLCADIGESLGCGGAMKSLVRSRVGQFMLRDALTLARLEELRDQDRLGEALLPVEQVFGDCPILHVKASWERLLKNGNALYPEQTEEGLLYEEGRFVRFCGPEEGFAGIYAYHGEEGRYQPVKMFLNQE